jgi:hypothetical protein
MGRGGAGGGKSGQARQRRPYSRRAAVLKRPTGPATRVLGCTREGLSHPQPLRGERVEGRGDVPSASRSAPLLEDAIPSSRESAVSR